MAFDLNRAVELFDDPLGDRQTKAQPAALGRHEIVENRRQAFRRDPRTGIADADLDQVACAGGRDGDAAAALGRLNRVGDEIAIDATQGEPVAFDDERPFRVTRLDADADALAPVRSAYGYGSSQSGRFLRGFLYEGFNTDEHDRQVFDGVMAHIAGASRLSVNERWAKPTGLGRYNATAFPFADASLRDPVSGAQDGLLDNTRMRGHAPKVFYTNTPVEYWGTGRVAALVHTSPDGATDLTLPENTRVYFIAGTQHSPSRFPADITNGQQTDNAVDYWWTMRALLLAMHKWVKEGAAPPASQYPRLEDHTLVPVASIAFPAIPGVASPRGLTAGARVANPYLESGAGAGALLPLLVPAVDEDGNERAGIRLPEVAVPLATYTGWNFRKPAIGAPGELVSLLGSSIFFPATRAAREAAKDPRRSIDERYRSQEDYLAKVEQAADALVKGGYLLVDDEPRILQRASDQWDLAKY